MTDAKYTKSKTQSSQRPTYEILSKAERFLGILFRAVYRHKRVQLNPHYPD